MAAAELDLVFIANEEYRVGLAATISSIQTACKQDVDSGTLQLRYVVVDLGLSQETRRLLGEMLPIITWQKLPPDVTALLVHHKSDGRDYAASACWVKLLLHKVLPRHDVILYLDCDIIVRKSLLCLWHEWQQVQQHPGAKGDEDRSSTAAEGAIKAPAACAQQQAAPLAAVLDIGHPHGHEQLKRYGWKDSKSSYFNAGVMFIDLKQLALKEEMLLRLSLPTGEAAGGGGDAAATAAACGGSTLKYHDQDALNLTFQGSWAPLPHTWNVQGIGTYIKQRGGAGSSGASSSPTAIFTAEELSSLVSDPAVVHFTGQPCLKPSEYLCRYVPRQPSKPWAYLCCHPFRGEFVRHLDSTPFRGWRPSQVR